MLAEFKHATSLSWDSAKWSCAVVTTITEACIFNRSVKQKAGYMHHYYKHIDTCLASHSLFYIYIEYIYIYKWWPTNTIAEMKSDTVTLDKKWN